MILALAAVQVPCARIRTWNGQTFNFHRVSEPVTGALPIFEVPHLTKAAR
jgi:hypothetical protein